MTRPLLRDFVLGARQVVALQLIIAVIAVALSGWTLAVTADLMRERERLRMRVVQLEEALVTHDIVVPSTVTVTEAIVAPRARSAYPPSAPEAAPPAEAAEAESQSGFNPGQLIGDLIAPAPPARVVVLHARGEPSARIAAPLARALEAETGVRVIVAIMGQNDRRAPSYAYYAGRQSGAASALVQRFNDIARREAVAPWSAQLRGTALPAQGEYAPDRIDIVLPMLTPAQIERLDPAIAEAAEAEAAQAAPPAP